MRFWTERGLLNGLRNGDSDAAREFIRRYQPTIYRFALSMTRSREDAEDVAQSTIVAAYKSASEYRGDSRLITWLHKIAYREVIRLPRRTTEISTDVEAGSPFKNAELGLALLDALESLGAESRDVFLLREVQGLSTKEAAAVLAVPEGTLKWRLSEAKTRLRVALTALGEKVEPTVE
jgi:RNA polymerase sigma-70 factor (ECF subfamily)